MTFLPNKKDIPELSKLWLSCFPDDPEYVSMFMEQYFREGTCVALKKDGKIISCLYLLFGEIKNENSFYKASFLYCACTDPAYRNQSAFTKVLSETLQYSRDLGCDYSFILSSPPSIGIIEKSGMTPCFNMDKCSYIPKNTSNRTCDFVIEQLSYSEFVSLRSSYLNTFSKSLIWDDASNHYIYNDIHFSGTILKLDYENVLYYASIEFMDEEVYIRETNLPVHLLKLAIDSIANYLSNFQTYVTYLPVSPQNQIYFSTIETVNHGHGIALKDELPDFDNCYINLVAE